MFWLYVLIMIVLALFMILYRSRTGNNNVFKENKEAVLTVYKQQFDDLETDLNSGMLTEEQAAKARLELEQSLLKEMDGENGTDIPVGVDINTSSDWLLNSIIMFLLPLMAIALYYRLGQPDLVNATASTAVAGNQSGDEQSLSIEELVVGLEHRLQQTPDDEKGWWMLTRSYMALDRYADALESIEHLYSLTGDEVPILLLYANVLMLNNGGSYAGEPDKLIQLALELEPENVGGLWLAGLTAQQRGDNDQAIAYWQKLLPLVADDEAASEQVKQSLAEVSGEPTGESKVVQ